MRRKGGFIQRCIRILIILIHITVIPIAALHAQNNVLFVEDNAGYGTVTHPDSLWHTILTDIYGIGNFGWFGPTLNKYDNGPDLATMQNYDLVIWNNYDHYGQPLPLSPTLTDVDQANITNYINSGGKLWLIAQDALYSNVPLSFLQTNFNLFNYSGDVLQATWTRIQGLAEAAGPSFLVTADYVTATPFYPDDLVPDSGAHHILKDADHNYYYGILRNDSVASFWTIDGRRPVLAITWEQLVTDMLNVFGVIPGINERPEQQAVHDHSIAASPRPFRATCTFTYSISDAGNVKLEIFDKIGSCLATLIDRHHTSGLYKYIWNGRNQRGIKIPAGVYFCKICCGAKISTIKIIKIGS